MHLRESLMRLINRFRYPSSLSENIARDVGLFLPNSLNFTQFLSALAAPPHPPTKLRKFMKRLQAESAFETAFKKEKFKECSLFSYYFNERGWVVFALHFDENDFLRRVYLQCPGGTSVEGWDLLLEEDPLVSTSIGG